jgi:hypothetical protein
MLYSLRWPLIATSTFPLSGIWPKAELSKDTAEGHHAADDPVAKPRMIQQHIPAMLGEIETCTTCV